MSYKCKKCGKKLSRESKSGYCQNCRIENDQEEKIKIWKETGATGCNVATTLRNCIRNYIYTKQLNKCAICNISNNWNNKSLNFVLDHIDGDASNNWEYNLRLICPNCDSQLDTFKSKNKNSARKHRKEYYTEEEFSGAKSNLEN